MPYYSRNFTTEQIESIRKIIKENPKANRALLARVVCEKLDWRRVNGCLKEMSARVTMIRMHEDGLILLPDPTRGNGNKKKYHRRSAAGEPEFPIKEPAGEIADLHLRPIAKPSESHLWNELIDRYHYLGFSPLNGAQIRYFVYGNGRRLACLGFQAAAWKCAPRDQWITWSDDKRKQNLQLIVNNSRFLILPWVKSRHLASKVLALAAKRLSADWQQRYGYQPVLLETFVQIDRFKGICYKAANWIMVGKTKGRGRYDTHNQNKLPIKTVWLYPLANNFRSTLCS